MSLLLRIIPTPRFRSVASDVDNSQAQLSWTASVLSAQPPANKQNPDDIFIDPSDLDITIDPTTHVVTFAATSDTAGVFTVKFPATDTSSASDTDTITVTVSPVSDPPVLVNPLSDIAYAEDGGPIAIGTNLNTEFANAEPVAMTFSASSDNPDISTAIQGSILSVNSTANYFGSGMVVVIADNGSITTASDTFKVTINSVNDAPVVTMSAITFEEDGGTTLDLDNFVSDPDHNLSDLNWTANILTAQAGQENPNFKRMPNPLIQK